VILAATKQNKVQEEKYHFWSQTVHHFWPQTLSFLTTQQDKKKNKKMLFITEISKVWWPWMIGATTTGSSGDTGSILLEGMGSERILVNTRRSRQQRTLLSSSASPLRRRRRTRRNRRVTTTQKKEVRIITKGITDDRCTTKAASHELQGMMVSQNKSAICERQLSLIQSSKTESMLLLSNMCYWCFVGVPMWIISTTIYVLAFALIGIQTCLLALCFVIWLQVDFILVMRHLCFFVGSLAIIYKPRLTKMMASLFMTTILISLLIFFHQFEGFTILKHSTILKSISNSAWRIDRSSNNSFPIITNHFLLPYGLWQTI
jgi:hypothetical protein